MADAKATLALGAVLKSGTKATFTAISGGLKAISNELQKTAKDLIKMGKVDASNAVGHVGMAIGKVAEEFGTYSKKAKSATKDTKELITPMKDMGKQLKVVQDAWKHYEKTGGKSSTAVAANAKFVKSLNSQLGDLSLRFKQAGLNQDAWLNSLKWSNVQQAISSKALDFSSGKMKINGDAGLRALNIIDKYATAHRKFSTEQSIYNRQLDVGAKISDKYSKAVRTLGKATGYNNEIAKVWAPTLKKVHSAMSAYEADMTKGLGVSKKWIKASNLASITQQVLAKNIEVTSKGFKVMNEGGLSAFKNLSYDAAKNLGMLSKGFAGLTVKEGSSSLTAYGKAQEDALLRSAKFRREMDKAVKQGTGVSKAFETRYNELKRTDELWRKHTNTLQQSGRITTETMLKMNASFNAAKIVTKDGIAGYQALSETLKRVSGDRSSLLKTLKDVSKETKISRQELTAEALAMRKNGVSTKAITQAMRDKVVAQNDIVKSYSRLQNIEQQRARTTGKSVESIRAESNARLDSAKGTKEYGIALKESLKTQKEQLNSDPRFIAKKKEMAKSLQDLNSKYGSLIKTNPQYVQQLKNVVTAYGQTSKRGRDAARALGVWSQTAIEARDRAGLFSRALGSIKDHIKSFASYAVAATVISSLTMLFGQAAMAIMDYDQALKDLQAITGATAYEVGLMGLKIKEVASNTKFSTKEVADGMKILGQAGLSASEAISSIDAVANLATGTLSDMATAVDLVTTAMRVFDISSEDSGRIADTFANAINKSKLTVDKLRTALNYVGPVAADANISLEETAASMMTLANAGLKASTIGTGLRRVIAELVSPSKKLKSAAERAGVPIEALNPTMTNFKEVLTNLQLVLSDTSQAFKIFGKYGAGSVLALINDLDGGYSKMLDSTMKFGTAAAMARTQMEGLGVAFKNMKDKFGLVAIALGDAGLTGVLMYLVQIGKTLADTLVFLVENALEPLLNVLSPILWILGQISVPVMSAVAAFFALRVALLAAASASKLFTKVMALQALGNFTTTVLTATGAVNKLRVALMWLWTTIRGINPWLALAGVIGAATMGMISLHETTEEQAESFEKLKSETLKNTNTLNGFIKELKRLQNAEAGNGEILDFMIKLSDAFPYLSAEIYNTEKDITKLFQVLYDELKRSEDNLTMASINKGFDSSYAQAKEAAKELAKLKVNWHPLLNVDELADRTGKAERIFEEHIKNMANLVIVARKVGREGELDWGELLISGSDVESDTAVTGPPPKNAIREKAEAQADSIQEVQDDTKGLIPFGFSKEMENELNSATTIFDLYIKGITQKGDHIPSILSKVNMDTVKAHKKTMEAFYKEAQDANNNFSGEELYAKRMDIQKRFQQFMVASGDKDLKDKSIYFLKKHAQEMKDHEFGMAEAKRKAKTEKQLDNNRYQEFLRHQKKIKNILNLEYDSAEAIKAYKVLIEERKAYNTKLQAEVTAQEESGLISHQKAERLKAQYSQDTTQDIYDGWSQLNAKLKDDNYLDKDVVKKTQKDQAKAYQANEVAKSKVVIVNSKMRIYTIKKEYADIAQMHKQHISEIEQDVATNTLSPDFADTAIRKEEIDSLSAYIEKLKDEQAWYAKKSAGNEKAKDLGRQINGLIIQKNKLITEETQKLTDQVQVMKDLNTEMELLTLNHKVAMAALVNDGGNTSYDSEVNRLKTIQALEDEASKARLKAAREEYALKVTKENATEPEKKEALVALKSSVDTEELQAYERKKVLASAEYALIEDKWIRGELSAKAYFDAVDAAEKEGVITHRQAVDTRMANTSDMFAAFKHGWQRYGEQMKTQAQLVQDMAGTIYEALTDGLADPLYDIISSSASAKDAFKDFANSVLEDLTKMALKMMLLDMFGSKQATGGTGSLLGNFLGFAGGGQIPGKSPNKTADNIPIMATAKEFVEPVDVVEHYGVGVFEALRRKLIPKDFMSMLSGIAKVPSSMSVASASSNRYASGGQVSRPSGGDMSVNVPINISSENATAGLVAALTEGIENTVMTILRREI